MDEELKTLESELRRLRPAAPSGALRGRLQRELTPGSDRAGTNREPRRTWLVWGWLALPIAAAAVFVFNLQLPSVHVPVPEPTAASAKVVASDTLKPVAAENVLYAAADEGLVTLDDGTPARRERLHFVDTITWRNPRTNASLTWSVPREEVRIVPVNFQ
jgi:hypothetical protein